MQLWSASQLWYPKTVVPQNCGAPQLRYPTAASKTINPVPQRTECVPLEMEFVEFCCLQILYGPR